MKKLGLVLLRWFVLAVLLALPVMVLPECGFLPDLGPPPAACELPVPEAGWTKLPTVTAEQQPRQDEVCRYITAGWKAQGYVRKSTKQMPDSGDVVDCMDEASVPGAFTPPPPTPAPDALVLPEGVQRARMEVEDYPDRQCEPGTIPFLRPDFWAYVRENTGASSLGDWIQNYQVVGAPTDDPGRRHAGYLFQKLPNKGANVSINAFGGGIEPFTFSLQEMVVGCRLIDPTNLKKLELWQQVGIAASRDNLNLNERFQQYPLSGSSILRLTTEFLTNGSNDPQVLGDNKGGWFHNIAGFVPMAGTPYAPGSAFSASTISTVDGIQYESLFQIKIMDGNWWIGHNGHWLGFFPKELFNASPDGGMIETQACELGLYGEVAINVEQLQTLQESWTWTPMTSGHFAEEGYGKVGYFRDPTYVSADAAEVWTTLDPLTATPAVDNPACYTSTPFQYGAAPSPSTLISYVGGNGRQDSQSPCQ